jgi:hypothetical protein
MLEERIIKWWENKIKIKISLIKKIKKNHKNLEKYWIKYIMSEFFT